VKLVYRRRRPRRPTVRDRTDSYPSGHTTGVTALATTTAFVLRRQGIGSAVHRLAIGIGAPALMGAFRVVADDHWATDVFGGWLLGAAIGIACNAVLAD
ncbi:MAG TPA: phosphatase PAP2 family protein, partial [Gemmatimonadaceae bacterium]